MRHDTTAEGSRFYFEYDGKQYPMKEMRELPGNAMGIEAGRFEGPDLFRPLCVEMRLKPMTKRRFKKLLMSRGIQRNQAEASAYLAEIMNRPYAIAWVELVISGNV